ncbi:MAG TPA: hypothetical protein VI815_01720 [Candidatus Nanoarchaeia archaeon]|nr:hypothetical protein [Candidatus Nanoarchaeia archaeon]
MTVRHEDLYEALGIIYDSVEHERNKLNWHLNGSFNLLVQGIDLQVKDLDIETDEAGLQIFREKLKEFLLEDKYRSDIEAHSLIFDISGIQIEILAHDNPELAMINQSRHINLEEMNIPILPFEQAKRFYKMIGMDEKVKLIEEHLALLGSLDV